MDRRLLLAVGAGIALGATSGAAVTAGLARWPAMCGVDGMLIWTALAAIGSVSAAAGAVYAARKAIEAAHIPVQASETARHAQAKVIAAAIDGELMMAAARARDIEAFVPDYIKRQRYELLEVIPTMRLREAAMLDRFLANFDVFGVDDGAKVALAASSILNLNGLIDQIAEWKYDTTNPALFNRWEATRLNVLVIYARTAHDFARQAQAIVTKLV